MPLNNHNENVDSNATITHKPSIQRYESAVYGTHSDIDTSLHSGDVAEVQSLLLGTSPINSAMPPSSNSSNSEGINEETVSSGNDRTLPTVVDDTTGVHITLDRSQDVPNIPLNNSTSRDTLNSTPTSPTLNGPRADNTNTNNTQSPTRSAATPSRATQPRSRGSISSWESAHIYFFVNPTSGGNAAAAFTNSGLSTATINIKPDLPKSDRNVCLSLHVFDIRDGSSGSKPGFIQLKESVDAGIDCIACGCGGDGTVVWMTSEIAATDIDDSNLVYSVIPYGTGNDFARAFNWNNFNALQPFENNLKPLHELMVLWFKGILVKMDIWSIDLELRDTGSLVQVSGPNGKRFKKTLKDDNDIPILKKSWKMFNYFSIGIDARIGIGFDRNRTSSQFRNKVVYIREGTKKLFKSFVPVDGWVSSMEDGDKTVFKKDSSTQIVPGTKSLVCLNVNSYGAGLDIWSKSKRHGLKFDGELSEQQKQLLKQPLKMGDGLIEWCSFRHKSSAGFEQMAAGHSRRVHKGGGPFELNMCEREGADRCYFQVDGEFYQCHQPKTFNVSHYKQVTVLANSYQKGLSTQNIIQR